MNKEFKKNFFTCLLAVLLVVSNLLCKKLTIIFGITTGVEFIVFPFTFLCTLLIVNLGDKKDAYRSILSASVIQLLITISYTIAINLTSQELIPDGAMYVNEVFKVEQFNVLSSVLAFILSHCLLIYIYDSFKHLKKEFYGVIIGLLGSLFLDSVIYLGLTLKGFEFMYIVDRLLINVIIDIVMIFIVTIIFYILKDHKKDTVIIENANSKKKEVVKEKVIKNKKKNDKRTNNNKNYYKKNNNTNRKNNSKNNKQKKTPSKKNVNNENI